MEWHGGGDLDGGHTSNCPFTVFTRSNKMKSETTDFAPVLPPGELYQTISPVVRLMTSPGELDET